MKIKGAMTILKNRAKFYGLTVEQLVEMMDAGFDETQKVTIAYEVYKMDLGYYWSGVNFETWIKTEGSARK